MSETTAPVTAADLTPGTVIRFKQSIFAKGSLTVRIVANNLWDGGAEVRTHESGNTYATMFGYRVRPADHSVSFGQRKVYCVNVDRIEVVQAAQS